ncbi:MAG: FtsL-like putative cell division protein [Prevotellaceae bacterium]|nr:FtsL-like putative cell division protein [Prevotellaceae bacterium]
MSDITNEDIKKEKDTVTEQKSEEQHLKAAIREQAIEDEKPLSSGSTLRKILVGEFLTAKMLKEQIWVIVIIVFFTLIYVSNRYSCQKDMLEINELNDKLKDAKYRALASSSELTELCRESNVLEMLKNNKDSILQIPNQPPYIIKVPTNE